MKVIKIDDEYVGLIKDRDYLYLNPDTNFCITTDELGNVAVGGMVDQPVVFAFSDGPNDPYGHVFPRSVVFPVKKTDYEIIKEMFESDELCGEDFVAR